MNIKVVALQDLLNNYSEDFIQDILNKFKSIPNHESAVQNDVECFGSLSNRVDETILVKELSSVRLLNSFFSCWSKKFRH